MIPPSVRLRRAILLDDILLVQRIVKNNPQILQNPDFEDKSNTSLHLAAAHGFTDIASHLINAGHDAHEISRNAAHDTPLMLAARNGHVEVATLLIAHFPHSIPFTNNTGASVLSLSAATPGSAALLDVLLTHPVHPASPHSKDQEGNTPLHHASASGSLKALRLLLEAGANPLAKNNYDWTPLAYSQTVAAEVYFKNLVAELERRKQEGARLSEEREKAKAAGLRIVDDEGSTSTTATTTPTTNAAAAAVSFSSVAGAGDDDEVAGDASKRHWSPVERKQPGALGSLSRHDWGATLTHMRSRSGG